MWVHGLLFDTENGFSDVTNDVDTFDKSTSILIQSLYIPAFALILRSTTAQIINWQ